MSKTIFITGTSTGFGKLTTITLANAGHTVIAGMRKIYGKNAAVAQELSDLAQVAKSSFPNGVADLPKK